MTRLTRFGLAAAFAVILAAPSARAAEPDPLLPSDADTVTFINVKQILASDVVKKYALDPLKQVLEGQDAKKLLDDMGLDPLKDIETVWVGSSGKDENDMKALIVIHGKFDPDKLLKAAEIASKRDADKFSIIRDGNMTLFKYQPDEGNPVYGTVLDEKTVLAASDKKIVSEALKQAETAKKAPISKELNELVQKMDTKSSMFAVSIVKGKVDNFKSPLPLPIDITDLEKAMANTESIAVTVKATADISLELTMNMKDEDSADNMGEAVAKLIDNIKGLIPLLTAADPNTKPLGDIVKTIKSDVNKKLVTVSGKITGDNIGKLINPGD